MGIAEDNYKKNSNKSKRKRRGVSFNDEEIIINPEDVDPSVGRFRNLIQTTVIPTKRIRMENHMIPSSSSLSSSSSSLSSSTSDMKNLHPGSLIPHLYQGLPPTSDGIKPGSFGSLDMDASSISKLGLILPNPAPDVLPATEEVKNIQQPIYSSSNPTSKLAIKTFYLNLLIIIIFFRSSTSRRYDC